MPPDDHVCVGHHLRGADGARHLGEFFQRRRHGFGGDTTHAVGGGNNVRSQDDPTVGLDGGCESLIGSAIRPRVAEYNVEYDRLRTRSGQLFDQPGVELPVPGLVELLVELLV